MNNIQELIKNDALIHIAGRYEEERNKEDDLGINIFELVSSIYHRENLHSDIIAFFLKSEEKHKHGNKYFKLFLEYLNKLAPQLDIKMDDFNEYSVKREDKRIDILIRGQDNKCIIVENKINNAADTYRQLPTYTGKIGKENICAIIYLSLDGNKLPDQHAWNEDEVKFIKDHLINISAYNNKENDIISGWLDKCLTITEEKSDAYFCLKQYVNLIKLLRGKIMETKELKEFYGILKNDTNYQTAFSIKNMMDNLGEYLAQQIVDWYNEDQFPIPFHLPPYVYHRITTVFGDWHLKSSVSTPLIGQL